MHKFYINFQLEIASACLQNFIKILKSLSRSSHIVLSTSVLFLESIFNRGFLLARSRENFFSKNALETVKNAIHIKELIIFIRLLPYPFAFNTELFRMQTD